MGLRVFLDLQAPQVLQETTIRQRTSTLSINAGLVLKDIMDLPGLLGKKDLRDLQETLEKKVILDSMDILDLEDPLVIQGNLGNRGKQDPRVFLEMMPFLEGMGNLELLERTGKEVLQEHQDLQE